MLALSGNRQEFALELLERLQRLDAVGNVEQERGGDQHPRALLGPLEHLEDAKRLPGDEGEGRFLQGIRHERLRVGRPERPLA